MNREQRLAETFVELADTLVKDFDVVELLDLLAARCAELLDVTAAALFLAPPGTGLRPIATSGSESRLSDVLAIAQHEGPVWEPGTMTAADMRLAQALADAAAIGILHERAVRRQADLAGQLHTALQSRILIEQAKGVLAARRDTTVETAFELMRGHARHHRRRIGEIARHVVETSGALPAFQDS